MACNKVSSSFGRGFCVWFLCISSSISSSIVGFSRQVFLFSQVLVSSCISFSISLNLCLQSVWFLLLSSQTSFSNSGFRQTPVVVCLVGDSRVNWVSSPQACLDIP